MSSGPVIERLRTAARALDSADHREALIAIQAAQDSLDAAKAHHLAALETSADYELDGASSVTAWARTHLRLDARETKHLVRADATMRELPQVAEAAASGSVRLEHLTTFTYGLKHVGTEVVGDAESWLLEVARTCEPSQLRTVVRSLREAVFPDELDRAWAEGMDKQDVQVSPVPEGWHLNGFLNQTTGAKLHRVLSALGAPTHADDKRTGAERRVTALDRLVTGVLENGLPSDKGIRPQMSVIVDAETLHTAMTTPPEALTSTATPPAELVGFGPIGPKLLSYLGCTSDITAILTSGGELPQARILNVGRTHRLATPAQRRAVIARQGGVCANTGCRNTHLEIHHVTPWQEGGQTNLDDLVGYCVGCHHLVHRGLLHVTARGNGQFEMTDRDHRPTRRGYRERTAARRELGRIRAITRRAQARRDGRRPLRV